MGTARIKGVALSVSVILAVASVIFLISANNTMVEASDSKTVESSETTKKSKKDEQTSKKETSYLKDPDFLQLPRNENPTLKSIANENPSKNSLPEDPRKAVLTILDYYRHHAESLWGEVKKPGSTIKTTAKNSQDLVVEINGKRYLNQEGRDIYSQVEAGLLDPETVVNTQPGPKSAFNTGVDKDGNFIMNKEKQDLSGQPALHVKFKDGSSVDYLDYCGNIPFNESVPGVPTAKIPNPPKPNKPPVTTPPVSPPVTNTPKDITQSPERNQEVIQKDTNNVRPGANGPENATVGNTPGTADQGSAAAAEQAAAEKAAQDAEAERQRAEAQAQRDAEAATAKQAAAEELARQQQAAADEAARKRAEEEAKKAQETNNGTVDSGF